MTHNGKPGVSLEIQKGRISIFSQTIAILKAIPRLLIFMAMATGNAFAGVAQDGPGIGEVPPALTLPKTIQGPSAGELTWDKLKGNVVVLEFWATWCGPCVKAIPHMNDLVAQFTNRPVVFISVTSENEDVVRLFLKKNPISACIGLDDYEVLNRAFHVTGIPHAFIIDAHGRIAAIAHPASIKPENLEEVLAGKKCSLPPPAVETNDRSAAETVSNEVPALFEISIREHKTSKIMTGPYCIWSPQSDHCGFSGKIADIQSALQCVFGRTPSRMEVNCSLPEGYYDFELRAPLGHSNELQQQFIAALRTTFDLEVKLVTRTEDVYILTQIATNAPGLSPVVTHGGGGTTSGGFRSDGCDLNSVAQSLEGPLAHPVFDETGLSGFFAVNMKWKLSASEQLMATTDRKVWRAIDANPHGDWISSLPPELREGEALEHDLRLKEEIAKPDNQQFLPDPKNVIAAARERLGLQLTFVQRPVDILEVNAGSVPPPLP